MHRLQEGHVQTEILAGSEEDSDEDAEESAYETDTSEEEFGRQMLKPVFVSKHNRDTIAEREALEREEKEATNRERVKI